MAPIDPMITPPNVSNVRKDLMNLPNKPTAKPVSPRPLTQPAKTTINEQMGVMSTEDITAIVRQEMANIMIKNIREEAIKDTIKTLMREGIIPTKK
jgi:hypothetical protein